MQTECVSVCEEKLEMIDAVFSPGKNLHQNEGLAQSVTEDKVMKCVIR